MGFFKVDRQIFDHWLWEDKPFSKGQAWIDLIGLANYEDGKAAYKGEVINCERGTVYRSFSYLADRWGWSRKKVKAFIELLVSDGMVTTKVTTHRTTITLVNYGKFQDWGTTKVTTEEQQKNSKGSNERRRIKNNKKPIGRKSAACEDEMWEGFLQLVKEKEEQENDRSGIQRDPADTTGTLQTV